MLSSKREDRAALVTGPKEAVLGALPPIMEGPSTWVLEGWGTQGYGTARAKVCGVSLPDMQMGQ